MLKPNPSTATPPGLRALLVGSIGCVAIGAGVPYCNMVLHGSRIASYFNTPAAIILFFCLVLFGNSAIGLLRRSWMLQRAELALIYIMWIVATAIPEWGLSAFLLPDITSLIYYATPENAWNEHLLPIVPEWMIPDHEFTAVRNFYEGAPAGQGIPWSLWIRPLAYWLPFILSLYVAMITIMVILRRQWMEQERLIYPLVQVPLSMLEEGEQPSLVGPFFRNPLMWLGFAVPAIVQSINGLHHYVPHIPAVYMDTAIPLFRNSVSIPIRLSFQMVGFTYFVNRDVAFGLLFFFLINTVQQGIFNILGLQKTDSVLGVYSAYTGTNIVHQGFGALVVLVLFSLWTGRGHLMKVLRKAVKGDPTIDDSDEILSYRAAVLLLLGSLTFMALWLWKSGLPMWITVVYLFLAFIVFVGITRVVSEGGLAHIFAPMIASDFVAANFGTRALGDTGIVAFAFTYVWASDILTFVMASCANALKLVQETIHRRRRLVFWAMIISIILTLLSSIWSIIELAYTYGGINTDQFFFDSAARYPFDNAAARIQSLSGPHWENWGYTAIGATIMVFLMWARHHWLWWPFHYLGFPISAVFGTMFFSVFLAWMIKTVVIKYGGPGLYLRTRPFFLGLILGQFVTAGIWYAIDFHLGSSDNVVMSW
ncbi:MAG: hypothetical protein QGI32_13795 [Candidatus Latescibacteria bacterium]|nr:hypothetical protein [Candidatus Latescibacterota bacterium]